MNYVAKFPFNDHYGYMSFRPMQFQPKTFQPMPLFEFQSTSAILIPVALQFQHSAISTKAFWTYFIRFINHYAHLNFKTVPIKKTF